MAGILVIETTLDCVRFCYANPNQRGWSRFIMLNLMNVSIIGYNCISTWVWIFDVVKNQPVNAHFPSLMVSIWDRWIIEAMLPVAILLVGLKI